MIIVCLICVVRVMWDALTVCIPSSKYGLAPPDPLDERTQSPDLPPPPPPDHEVGT